MAVSLVRSNHTLITCASVGSNGENNLWLDHNPTWLSSNQGFSRPQYLICCFPGSQAKSVPQWLRDMEDIISYTMLYLIKLSWVLCILQNYLACCISYITICICFVSLRTISACFVSRTSSHACFVNYLVVFYTILNYLNIFCPLQNCPSVFCILQNYPSMRSICLHVL